MSASHGCLPVYLRKTRMPYRRLGSFLGLIFLLSACSTPIHRAVDDNVYIAAGDSYASGADLAPMKPAASECWRYIENASALVAASMGVPDNDHTCRGAKIGALFEDYQEPPMLEDADENTRFIWMMFGGNDTNYALATFGCITGGASSNRPDEGTPCRDQSGAALDEWIALFRERVGPALAEARQRAPNAIIVYAGYPNPYPADPFRCPFGTFGPVGRMTKGDIAWFRDKLTEINTITREAALAHGVRFIDMASHFTGHDACAGANETWIAPAQLPKDTWPLAGLHPNREGHRQMAKLIAAEFHVAEASKRP